MSMPVSLVSKEASQPVLPQHFILTNNALYFQEARSVLKEVCSPPVLAIAYARDAEGDSGHGLIIRYLVGDKEHERYISAAALHGNARPIFQKLAGQGIAISPENAKLLSVFFIESMKLAALPETLLLRSSGFVKGELVSVWRGRVYQNDTNPNCYRVEPPKGQFGKGLAERGTLDEYQEQVIAKLSVPAMKFAIVAALAPPLADFLELEGGGIHIFGPSGCGKSTFLQISASVMGNGSDPGNGVSDSLIGSWNATSNSFDATLPAYSGLGMYVDELGSRRQKNLGKALYGLLSGKPKARMRSDLRLHEQQPSSVFLFSSGELSVSAKVAAEGDAVKAGILARLASIPVEPTDMAADGEDSSQTAQRINAIKEACSRYYGVLGPAFLYALVNAEAFEGDALKAKSLLKEMLDDTYEAISGEVSNPIQARVLRRFALIHVAGQLAIEAGLLPWSLEELDEAVNFMKERWENALNESTTDLERAIQNLQHFLRRNYHNFPESNDHSFRGTVSAYKHRNMLLILPKVFEGLCGDCQPIQVMKELKRMQVLKHETGKLKYRIDVEIAGGRQPFIAIDSRFLQNDAE